jgi:hypothetical protein
VEAIKLFLDDNRGIYIPRDFAQCVVRESVTGISAEDYAILEDPDHELYWDVWDDVLNGAELTDTADGSKWRLHQDGALFLVNVLAEYDEERDEYFIPNPLAEHYTAPSIWASYLINGDESSLRATDKAQCDAWVESLGYGPPVDARDAGFIHHHDAYAECPLGADCQRYTFLRKE